MAQIWYSEEEGVDSCPVSVNTPQTPCELNRMTPRNASASKRSFEVRLVVQRVLWVCEIENHSRVWLTAAAVLEFLAEIDRTVEGNTAIIIDVDVLCFEIGWNVDNTDLPRLHEVIGDDDVLLIRRHLNVVRANDGMHLVGIIETLDVVEVANVQSSDMVGRGEGHIQELAILSKISAK